MLNDIKQYVKDNQGIFHIFRFNGIRNQSEEFVGKIIGVYPAIFTIELENKLIRSFSYSDLLVDNLEIID